MACNRHVDIFNSWASSWATLVVEILQWSYPCWLRYLPIFFATSESIYRQLREWTEVPWSSHQPQTNHCKPMGWLELNTKARDFSETARDDGCFGIVTITKISAGPQLRPRWYSSRLQRFPLRYVCIGIEARVVIAKEFLNIACSF